VPRSTSAAPLLGHVKGPVRYVFVLLIAFIVFVFFSGGFAILSGTGLSASDFRLAAILTVVVLVALPLVTKRLF
jgi:hypothetical protein